MHGIRLVVDAVTGAGGVDVTLPAGARWTVDASRTKWVYADATGSAGGVTRAVILDRSKREDGLLRFTMKDAADDRPAPSTHADRRDPR